MSSTTARAAPCSPPDAREALRGPSPTRSQDLDLQFHWRTATVCQEVHALERSYRFGPLPQLVVRGGEGHRVLLLLPSLAGKTSLAAYRVALPETTELELLAWVALEAKAGAGSDGVDFGIGVGEANGDPAAVPLRFARLAPEEARSGWREVRFDLSAYRGKAVWLVLASRDGGSRDGDWLLWADPRVIVKHQAPLRIDLGEPEPAGDRAPHELPWAEVNVFKAYSGFHEDAAKSLNSRWAEGVLPWLGSLRLFSSLGANWGPTLERDYDGQMGHNPTRDSSEEQRWARYYEFFRDGPTWEATPVRDRFDWQRFDQLYARIASSGLRLHINLSGAPELFTGGKGHYHTYHFNEMPVVDEVGWKTYVDEVFRHLSQQPWFDRTEYSFFSEPNCRWVEHDGTVRHFGYQGDAAQYALQYLWTWQAMKPYVRPGQVHLGPFVVEPDPAVPAVDNLPEHLRVLRETFGNAGEPLPPWSAFAFNIYETPQLAIDHFASYKVAYVRGVLRAELPGLELPLRFDEVGIHPIVASEFASAGVAGLEGSRWSAAWHAEMLALLVEQRIESGGPWMHNELMRPHASYVFLSLVAGAFDLTRSQSGGISLVHRPPEASGAGAGPVRVRLGSASADRIGYLWSAPAGKSVARLAVWRIPRFPMSNARIEADASVAHASVRVPDCERTHCTVMLLGYDDQVFPSFSGQPAADTERVSFAAIPNLPALRRIETRSDGEIDLSLRPGDVYFVEWTTADSAS